MNTNQPITIQVRRLPHHEGLPLPSYMSASASGMDAYAANEEDMVLNPGHVLLVPTGLELAIPHGYEVQVRPRSGLALKHGVTLVNSPGTIDSDYRGEVGVIVGNVSSQPFTITRGMRIAQLIAAPVLKAELEVVEILPDTERGTGGFGHTGTH